MKLKNKMFLIFSVIAILPMVLLAVFSTHQYISLTTQRINDISREQEANIVREISEDYASVRQAMKLLTFANNGAYSIVNILRPYSDPEKSVSGYEIYQASLKLMNMSQNIFDTYDFLKGVYIFTPAKDLISYTTFGNGSVDQHYNPQDDGWYQDTLKLGGRLYASTLDVHPMFQTPDQSIFFAQSIIDIDTRKFLGVIVLDCSPDLFTPENVNILGDMNTITLTNTDNGSVYYTNRAKQTDPADASNMHSSVTSIKNTPLELSLTLDYSSLYIEYRSNTILLLIFSSVCIVCILLLSFYISNNMITPILQLSTQMLHQKSLQLSTFESCSYRKDEIGILYREYNHMIEKQNSLIKSEYQNKLITMDAQMKALEARINSHFLFNTLESINSMAEIAEHEEISTMSLALGNMFRYAVKTKGELVTLRQELEHVNDYVSIQKIRFDNRFRLDIDIPENLYEQQVLKLILQPLIENSLTHGLNYCSIGDLISISACIADHNLLIRVSDNGSGIPRDELNRLRDNLRSEASFTELGVREKQSIGLKNIQSRIELYYGKGYGLTIYSEEGKGTDIDIKIPVLKKEMI